MVLVLELFTKLHRINVCPTESVNPQVPAKDNTIDPKCKLPYYVLLNSEITVAYHFSTLFSSILAMFRWLYNQIMVMQEA